MGNKLHGESVPLEIERKFLIKYPDISILEKAKGYNVTEIFQTYLESDKDGCNMRVRKRGINGKYTYTVTYKKSITEVIREEYEKQISQKQYDTLLARAKKGFNTIVKQRHCFYYNEKLFELDTFPFWNDRAFLEIELTCDKEQFDIPPFVAVIKEVTADKRYRNFALAQSIITESI